MSKLLSLIGREDFLFTDDIEMYQTDLNKIVKNSTFHVIGGAESIGQAATKELFKLNPKKLHVVDFSENNLTELALLRLNE